MPEVNPWSDENWHVTAQGRYLQQFGMARAQARARDAGTFVGGPRPRSTAGLAPPERKPTITVNKIIERQTPGTLFIFPTLSFDLGLDVSS